MGDDYPVALLGSDAVADALDWYVDELSTSNDYRAAAAYLAAALRGINDKEE